MTESELKEVIEDLLYQFSYNSTTKDGPALWAGGLSALEAGFHALGWEDKHPIPECLREGDTSVSVGRIKVDLKWNATAVQKGQ